MKALNLSKLLIVCENNICGNEVGTQKFGISFINNSIIWFDGFCWHLFEYHDFISIFIRTMAN